MKFDVPFIISEEPQLNDAYKLFPKNPGHAKIYHRIAYNVYTRTRAAEAQSWRCCWCGRKMWHGNGKSASVTREHMVPRTLGGTDHYDNIAAACYRCNMARGIMHPEEFMEHVIKLGWNQARIPATTEEMLLTD